ncbi:MAG: hypothetical protein PHR65_06830 [Syntrophomonadaceae bacterium]|nr:hypothetical protein [Syntrophomonadaceae bacterium]
MLEWVINPIVGSRLPYCLGIQYLDLKEYLDSYLLMAGGSGLIVLGVILALILHVKDRNLKVQESAAETNRQIMEAAQSARIPEQYNAKVINQSQYAATVNMDMTSVYRPSDNNETSLINRNLEETSLIGSLSSSKRPAADQDETAYLNRGSR